MLNLVLPSGGGGKTTPKDLEQIAERPDATAVRISRTRSRHVRALCHQVRSPVHRHPLLEVPSHYRPQSSRGSPAANSRGVLLESAGHRSVELFGDTESPGACILRISRTQHARRPRRRFVFGRARLWQRCLGYLRVCDFGSSRGLGGVGHLTFSAKRIMDGRVQPLAKLTSLETLSFPTNLFTTEQCAWLRAGTPESVTGRILEPVMRLSKPIIGSDRDTLVIGKESRGSTQPRIAVGSPATKRSSGRWSTGFGFPRARIRDQAGQLLRVIEEARSHRPAIGSSTITLSVTATSRRHATAAQQCSRRRRRARLRRSSRRLAPSSDDIPRRPPPLPDMPS